MSELPDRETHLAALDLWYDPRRGDYSDAVEDRFFYQQGEATQKMYYDHAESLALYKQSGGTV